MPDRVPRFAAIRGAFSNRNYAIYTSGNAISLIGWWVQRLTVGWLAWELTHSSSWLGAVAFADLFPVVLIGPFGGVLADRLDRRRLLVTCVFIHVAQATALFVLTLTGLITIELLFALTLVFGITIGFQQPARLALIPSLVKPENLTPAVALTSVIFNTARFVGPAIAGFILAYGGAALSFLVNALTYLAMIAALLMLRLPPAQKQVAHQAMVTEIRQGILYLARHPVLAPLMLVMIVNVLSTRPILEFLPAFADTVFERGPAGLATLTSAVGLGAVAGGLWLAQWTKPQGLATIALIASAISGLTLAVFSASDWFAVGVVAITVFGVSVSAAGVSVQTLMQTEAEDSMRGRVLSLWGLTFRGGPAVSALAIGWIAELFGVRWPMIVCGLICLAVSVVMFARRGRQASRPASSTGE